MKNLKWLICFLVSLWISQAKAQVFSVGDTSCNYRKVNYVFPGPCVHPSSASAPTSTFSGTYSFDIDGDFVNDVSLLNSCYWTPGGSSSVSENYMAVSSGSNGEFAYAAMVYPYCTYTTLATNLPVGTPLNASLTWTVAPPV